MKERTYFVEQMEAEYTRGNIQEMNKFRFSMSKAYIMLLEHYFSRVSYIQTMHMFIKCINSG